MFSGKIFSTTVSFPIFLEPKPNKVLWSMIKKKKFGREVIIIFICLNKLFIFSTNYVYCKNKKYLSKECLVDNYYIKN